MSDPVNVPDGWEKKRLGDLCNKITDGSHASPKTVENGFPIATVENMKPYRIDVGSCRTISSEDFLSLERGSCSPDTGDVLFSKDGTIGKTFVYNQSDKVVLLSSIAILKSKKDTLLPDYLTQYLRSPFFFRAIELTKSGSAIKRIVLKDIKSLKLQFPPLPEQKKIASILTSVDDVIEKTESQISKLQDLKKGMMTELLTKGIGHTEFKDSPVGRIPVSWEVCRTGEIADSIVPGRNKPKKLDGDIPWLTINDLDQLYCKKSKSGYGVSRKILSEAQGKTVPANSVIMSVVGDFGIASIATTEVVINQQLHGFVCKENIMPLYLCFVLIHQKRQQERLSTKTTISYMNKENAEAILFPLPSMGEQKKICDILYSLEKSMVSKTRKLSQTKSLKKALMNDLLTGRVRLSTTN